MKTQVAVVGAGPAGLMSAIHLARNGLQVVVCEQRAGPPDKACGEGLMPSGVKYLEALGVRELLGEEDSYPFQEIHYVQDDGTVAVGALPDPGGLGIRRTALTEALARAAADDGAELRWNCRVIAHQLSPDMVSLQTSEGIIEAELLVAADGLHSPLRRAAGMAVSSAGPRRFGLRRHYRSEPSGPRVEIHLGDGAEAFVTPVGRRRLGVAILWEQGRVSGKIDFESLLAGFPRLARRLGDAEIDSTPMGAGPLAQGCLAPVSDRLVLIGDAAGYVDAVTGEGMSLAFAAAAVLGTIAPTALARGADRAALWSYAKAHRRAFAKYARVTQAVLTVARRPGLRRRVISILACHPGLLNRLIAWGIS